MTNSAASTENNTAESSGGERARDRYRLASNKNPSTSISMVLSGAMTVCDRSSSSLRSESGIREPEMVGRTEAAAVNDKK